MDELLRILTADEKKMEVLTSRLTAYKKNIANETQEDTATRTDLGKRISAIKKSNAVIVNHYLGERELGKSEIDQIVTTHTELSKLGND